MRTFGSLSRMSPIQAVIPPPLTMKSRTSARAASIWADLPEGLPDSPGRQRVAWPTSYARGFPMVPPITSSHRLVPIPDLKILEAALSPVL